MSKHKASELRTLYWIFFKRKSLVVFGWYICARIRYMCVFCHRWYNPILHLYSIDRKACDRCYYEALAEQERFSERKKRS